MVIPLLANQDLTPMLKHVKHVLLVSIIVIISSAASDTEIVEGCSSVTNHSLFLLTGFR